MGPKEAFSIAVLGTCLALNPGCKKTSQATSPEGGNRPNAAEILKVELNGRMEKAAALDAADGADDFELHLLIQKNKNFLEKLEGENPQEYTRFILRLKEILKIRKDPQDEEDIELELGVFDLTKLFETLKVRDSIVAPDGKVDFPTPELEQRLSLADLTPDKEIEMIAGEKTLSKMGITATGTLKVFRVEEDTTAFVGKREVTIKAGTFVVKVKKGGGKNGDTKRSLFRVFVFDGDTIVDSLSKGFAEKGGQSAKRAPKGFEKFLKIKLPDLSLQKARSIFHEVFPGYTRILTSEYKELLTANGVSYEKHFVYYLQWAEKNNIPVTDDSVRAFFDLLLKNVDRSTPEGEASEGGTEDGSEDGIIKKALDFLKGEPDEDENVLSYKDQRAKEVSQQAEVALKAYGPLYALVRVQGQFTDEFTYNRLSGNFSAKVSSRGLGKAEYLYIEDIQAGLSKSSPRDIIKAAQKSTFAERIKATTTFNESTDKELREALAFSESTIGLGKASPSSFRVVYGQDGEAESISYNGKPYNPSTFITSPGFLDSGNVDDGVVKVSLGGLRFTIDIQKYFDRYHALESQNEGESQKLLVYDKQENQTIGSRNPMWFVEKGDSFYEKIAEIITKKAKGPHAKVLEIGKWLQTELDYIPEENAEINKITYGTLMDRGGDCEDSFTAYKTLANSLGLGDYVGAVFFKGHIAAMVKGNHGKTTYNVNGEVWTIIETATEAGVSFKPGETNQKTPVFFVLPNGKKVSADRSRFVPLEIVEESEIDTRLLADFEKAVQEVEDFVSSPENQATEANSKGREEFFERAIVEAKKIGRAHIAIIERGKTTDSISDEAKEATQKMKSLLAKWKSMKQKAEVEKKKIELDGQPEKVTASYERYEVARKDFLENIIRVSKEFIEVIKKYEGSVNNKELMIQAYNELMDIINTPVIKGKTITIKGQELPYSLIVIIDVMRNEYNEVLKYLPQEIQEEILKDLEEIMGVLNGSIYGPLNEIRRILRAHDEGR